jgi:uncharacterized protein (TIGR03067 family)
MSHRVLIGIVVSAVGVSVAAPVPKPRATPQDARAFEGTWQVKRYEGGVPPAGDKLEFRFADGKWFVTVDGAEGARGESYKLFPTTNPPGIDVAEGDRLTPGSYRIDGDRMRIVLPRLPKAERPTTFDVTTEVVVFTLQRLKGK